MIWITYCWSRYTNFRKVYLQLDEFWFCDKIFETEKILIPTIYRPSELKKISIKVWRKLLDAATNMREFPGALEEASLILISTTQLPITQRVTELETSFWTYFIRNDIWLDLLPLTLVQDKSVWNLVRVILETHENDSRNSTSA